MDRLIRRAALALAVCAFAATSIARADATARCRIRSIEAQPSGGGIDGGLADLRAQLSNPPFTQWKSFKLLADHNLTLSPGGTSSFQLPDGREGLVKYIQHLQPQNGRHRVRLHLEVKKGAESQLSTTFVLDEGGTVLVAGHPHGNGITILGVSCATGA